MSVNRYSEAESAMMQLFNRFSELSKKTYEYCEGVSLYPTEIHTIEYIALTSSTNMTDIANQMGLTKGAVSKMIVKLESQGLLERYKYQPSQKDIYIHLTKLGVRAFEGHKAYHASMWANLNSYFGELSPEQQQVVLGFLGAYLKEMQNLE